MGVPLREFRSKMLNRYDVRVIRWHALAQGSGARVHRRVSHVCLLVATAVVQGAPDPSVADEVRAGVGCRQNVVREGFIIGHGLDRDDLGGAEPFARRERVEATAGGGRMQIGRASCRESVWIAEVGGLLEW